MPSRHDIIRPTSGKRNSPTGGIGSDSGSGAESKKTSSTGSGSPDEGYAADWESLASKNLNTRPPEELRLRHHHHHHHGTHHQADTTMHTTEKTRSHPNPCTSDENTIAAKRQKLAELQFAAHKAIKDIEAAGLPIPELRADRPRAISFTTTDVSRVNFFFSSQLAIGSGSLIEAIRAKAKKQKERRSIQQGLSKGIVHICSASESNEDKVQETNKRSIFTEDERIYNDIVQTTAAFYRSTKPTACFDTESSTSSVSDTESDDANVSTQRPITAVSCSNRIILAAPSQASVTASSCTTPMATVPNKFIEAPKTMPKHPSLPPSAMTMGDALNFSKYGRYVQSYITFSHPFFHSIC